MVGEPDGTVVQQLRLGASGARVERVRYRGGTAVRKTATAAELTVLRDLAPQLPVRVPRLIDHDVAGGGVVVLLEDVTETGPVVRGAGDTDGWRAVVDDLAALHAADVPTVRRAGAWLDEDLCAPDAALLEEFWAGTAVRWRDVHDRRAEVAGRVAGVPAGPVHGDCHLDNVLRTASSSGSALVWLDWAEHGRASGALDLGFCSARAVPDGRGPLPDAALARYAARRGLPGPTVRRAVHAVELAVLVVSWPAFARFHGAAALGRVRRRAAELAAAW